MANEVRLIDANALKKMALWMEMPDRQGINYDVHAVSVLDIDNAPTIDPESIRPKGRKERSAISKTGLMCTNCFSDVDLDAVFCKYCGAKMEENHE